MQSGQFRSIIRNLESNKLFSLINIVGFAIGISICIVIVLFLLNEYSFDRYHQHADQIVRVIDPDKKSSFIDYRVKDILLKNYPEIKNACLVFRHTQPIEVRSGEKGFYLDDIMSVDNSFFDVFSVEFAEGRSKSPFVNTNSAIITKSTAKKLFGNEKAIGKNLLVFNHAPVTIVSVIKDFPSNSSISAGLLVNAENDNFKFIKFIGNGNDPRTFRWPFTIYLQLTEYANPDKLFGKINERNNLLQPFNKQLSFLKLKDMHLFDTSRDSDTKKGNPKLLKLLTWIAIIILMLAVINFINLSIAQQSKQNKFIGVRKAIGASKYNIFSHFILESVFISFLAFGVAILLTWILLPFYNAIFDTQLSIKFLFRFPLYLFFPVTILFMGLISGIGPAIIFSFVNPVKILSGNTILLKRSFTRNILTVFQFTVSIILIFCVISIQRQIFYVKHNDLGFDQEQLLRLDLPNIQDKDLSKAFILIDELKNSPFIRTFSATSGVPGQVFLHMSTNMTHTDKNMVVPCLIVDTAFIKTFGLKILKGRNIEPGDYGKVCMINEEFYKYFEFDNLVHKRFNNFGGFDIIGVVNNFHFSSLHQALGPICILFTSNTRPSSINIRFTDKGLSEGMNFIRESWQKLLPGYAMKYQFYDDWFDSMYHSEERFAQTIAIFALLAMVLSCIGILGLAVFSSERRVKEIGIRKVNGAKFNEVMLLLNKEFIQWVMIACIIAYPIAWYAMTRWLEDFAYKTDLSWWLFALAGSTAMIFALLIASWQSWRAAARNPVESLRYE